MDQAEQSNAIAASQAGIEETMLEQEISDLE